MNAVSTCVCISDSLGVVRRAWYVNLFWSSLRVDKIVAAG